MYTQCVLVQASVCTHVFDWSTGKAAGKMVG